MEIHSIPMVSAKILIRLACLSSIIVFHDDAIATAVIVSTFR